MYQTASGFGGACPSIRLVQNYIFRPLAAFTMNAVEVCRQRMVSEGSCP